MSNDHTEANIPRRKTHTHDLSTYARMKGWVGRDPDASHWSEFLGKRNYMTKNGATWARNHHIRIRTHECTHYHERRKHGGAGRGGGQRRVSTQLLPYLCPQLAIWQFFLCFVSALPVRSGIFVNNYCLFRRNITPLYGNVNWILSAVYVHVMQNKISTAL